MPGFFDPLPKGELDLDQIKQWVQNNTDTFHRSISMQGTLFSADFVEGTSGWRLLPDGTANFNEDVDIGGADTTEAQLFIHNTVQHLNLLENDDPDYPRWTFIIDVNALEGRIFWRDADGGPSFLEMLRFNRTTGRMQFRQDGAAATPIIENADADAGIFFDSGVLGISIADAEVARFEADAGHNLQGLAWTTWTPSLVNLNIGSTGTMVARYVRMGDVVYFDIHVTLGGAGISVGDATFSVPVAENAEYSAGGDDRIEIGRATFIDAATATFTGVTTIDDGVLRPRAILTNATHAGHVNISSTVPFTWVATDRMWLHGWYEAA